MKKWFGVAAVAGMLVAGFGQIAQAADDYKSFGVRVRAIYVKPSETTGGVLNALNTKVSDDIIPELDLEYFITKNFSTELIAGVTRHDIKLAGGFAGSTWLLPPTLTIKYHPLAGSLISPYIGFGLNATFPFNAKVNNVSDFKIDNSIGWAAQAGTDIKVADNLYLNLDYKYLNVNTTATVGGTKNKLNLNPSLVGIGVGYRF